MNSKMEKAMSKMLLEVVSEISSKYGVDISEVKKEIGLDVKIVNEKEKNKVKEKKIILPFCGRIDDEKCQGIKINYGLYTQCENNIFQKNLCKTCHKQSEKNSDGKPNYGTIDERMDKNYKDKNGKKPIKYSKFMQKMIITREMAEKEAEKQGLTIPEEEFEIKKTSRGRPKKSTSTTDTSDEESIAEPKKRGRPTKEKKVIENGNVGDDLIKNLIEEANKSEPKKEATLEQKKEETPEPENDDDDDSDDDEETVVVPFTFKGVKYLKAADNTVYDNDTHEEVGIWDEEKQEIVPDDDSEHED